MKKQTTIFLTFLACLFFSQEMYAQPNLIYQSTPGNSYGLSSCNEFGDIDNDGDLDLIIGGYSLIEGNSAVILYRNDGGTSFVLEATLANLMDGTANFADVDNDGDLDIFLTGKDDSSQEACRLFINDGTGSFTEDLTQSITPVSYSAVDFGDVDNDGDLDLIITGETSNSSIYSAELYLNDGSGNFMLDASTSFSPGRGGDIHFFDCDGDGDLDFIVTGGDVNSTDANTELHLNDGSGNFSIDNTLAIDDFSQSSFDVGDVDGDGDIDVLMNGEHGSNVDESVLYLNDGTGSFTASTGPTFLGGTQGDIKFGDLDGDSDLDFIVQGWPLPDEVLETYLNDGNGNYTIVSPSLYIPAGVRNGEISIGDINQSGMNDVFITGYRQSGINMSHLYRNFTLPCVPTASSFPVTACDSYTVPSGDESYTTDGVYMDTIQNSGGCDSVMTISVTITNSTTSTDVHTACNEFTWIDGNTYTSSNNTATFVLTNTAGCDSLVTLDLTILPIATGTDVQTACDSYLWIDGNTYTSSNSTSTFTISNGASNGCDSIVTLNLTITNASTGTDFQTACDEYTWIDGVTYTSDNNTATFVLTNSVGCDSVVTLDLTVVDIDATVSVSSGTITANANSGNYQWVDCDDNNAAIAGETNQSFTPGNTGNYAVIISDNNCDVTSDCQQISVSAIEDFTVNNEITVYPNPNNGEFFIEIDEDAALEVLDVTGKVIALSKLKKGINTVTVNAKSNGLYLLKIISQKGIVTKRIAVQN